MTTMYNDYGLMALRQEALPEGLTLVMTDGSQGRQYMEVTNFSEFCPEHQGQGKLMNVKMYIRGGDPHTMIELITVEVTPPLGSGRPDPYDYDCFIVSATPEARKFFLPERAME